MSAQGGALLAVRFLLELAALASLAYWGFTEYDGVVSILLGVGAPLVAAVVWGLFVSPKARYGSPIRQAVGEAAVFGAAVIALFAADQPVLAIVFAAVALADGVLVRVAT
jgi:Protein of unknown function (DUF2568)